VAPRYFSAVWQSGEKRLPVAHFDSLTATALEPPKKSSTYLSGYASGFFVASALFRHNSQNAHYGIFFHHPASTRTGHFVTVLVGPHDSIAMSFPCVANLVRSVEESFMKLLANSRSCLSSFCDMSAWSLLLLP
jgi:hypothetical protein